MRKSFRPPTSVATVPAVDGGSRSPISAPSWPGIGWHPTRTRWSNLLVGVVTLIIALAGCSQGGKANGQPAQQQANTLTTPPTASVSWPAQPGAGPPVAGGGVNTQPAGATNPAVTQANTHSTICVSGWTDKARPPSSYTQAVERMLIARLPVGVTHDASAYTVDHLIPLEVGGAPFDLRNLWLEKADAAKVKDRVENQTKRDVCAGRMTLQAGQTIFTSRQWQ